MARQARTTSETGYYHVIVRGIGKQIIFEDNQDYNYYLAALEKYSRETSITVCAYCLMSNHTHLLILDKQKNISTMMKKLGVSYSYYFNQKYERSGHLFQDRFKSEAIMTDRQLLRTFGYILNNPVKAGICKAENYPWSSYHNYGSEDSFVDTSYLEALIGGQDYYAEVIEIMGHFDNEPEQFEVIRNDRWAKDMVREVIGTTNGTTLKEKDPIQRNEAIAKLRKRGLSVRQIERLTGVSRGVIQKVKIG